MGVGKRCHENVRGMSGGKKNHSKTMLLHHGCLHEYRFSTYVGVGIGREPVLGVTGEALGFIHGSAMVGHRWRATVGKNSSGWA